MLQIPIGRFPLLQGCSNIHKVQCEILGDYFLLNISMQHRYRVNVCMYISLESIIDSNKLYTEIKVVITHHKQLAWLQPQCFGTAYVLFMVVGHGFSKCMLTLPNLQLMFPPALTLNMPLLKAYLYSQLLS